MSCEFDGESITNLGAYRKQSPLFEFTVPPDNLPEVSAGTGFSVSDSYIVIVGRLEPGQHTIHTHGEVPAFGFVQDITYLITAEILPELSLSSRGGVPALQVTGPGDRQCVVEYTPDLRAPWISLAAFTLTNSPQTLLDLAATNVSQRFYRARLLP